MEEVLTIRVPKGTRRRLERRARAENLTLSQFVRRALDNEELVAGLRAARAELVLKARGKCVYTDEDVFAVYLYAPDMPDPDLVIRTSGELRMSNFLLWQLAYSEFFFVETLWPDFGEEELRQAVAAYAGRQRRFGRR